MNTKQCSLLAVSILLASQAHSAGFQVAEHSASGLGRAFSGEGAIADNASVLARNPAAMMRFEQAAFSGAISFIDPEIDVKDVSNNEQSNDIAPFQVVPASYYIAPINQSWAWGLGLFTNYGVATDYPTDISAGDMAGNTSLRSVNLNPNIAYRLNESWSFGAGLNLVYAEAELTRYKGETTTATGGNANDKLIGMTGETFGYGWNIGTLYELDEDHRFSLAYRSAVKLDFDEGKFSSYSSGIATEPTVTGRLKVELPAIIELSGFHQLNSQWAVHYSWQRTDWSTFTKLEATSPKCTNPTTNTQGQCFYKAEDYNDNDRLSLGATYQLNKEWTLRAGYAFDEQAGKATLSIPDSDRHWYSTGFTYQWSPALSFDAGFALVLSDDGSFKETNGLGYERTFESQGRAFISSIQINYLFN
ncbi:porin [Vibrio sp.]|uniref:porin n=1 Tax=Vibrio sp. TaxID=678 RepID=UPI00311FFA22